MFQDALRPIANDLAQAGRFQDLDVGPVGQDGAGSPIEVWDTEAANDRAIRLLFERFKIAAVDPGDRRAAGGEADADGC